MTVLWTRLVTFIFVALVLNMSIWRLVNGSFAICMLDRTVVKVTVLAFRTLLPKA